LEEIPFLDLSAQHKKLRSDLREAFTAVIDQGRFILGNEVSAFEREFADYIGVPYCVGVGNGLDAITLALLSVGIRPGDEVIVPAHTYFATWLGVTRTGALPVPVDADPVTLNIDVGKIREKISPRTKAIVPVHLYGQACNMTAIDEVARQFGLTVIEDNAQAHGAMWRQKRTGSFGLVNATSFYPTKNLGALGDGGAVTTFHDDNASFIRRHRNYGLQEKNLAVEEGINSRLDEMQASFLRVKLKHLDECNEVRRNLAGLYLRELQGVGDLLLPLADKEGLHVYHLFVIRTSVREKLKEYLATAGVETMVHYPVPPHLQPAFRHLDYKKGDFSTAEAISECCLSLPLWPGMKDEQVRRVCDLIRTYFSHQS
jgi:dTDP-4-amino-4,6-dideoxygalactose transaminase